jgi:hypothetical protein
VITLSKLPFPLNEARLSSAHWGSASLFYFSLLFHNKNDQIRFKYYVGFPQSEKRPNIVDVIQSEVCHKVLCVTLTFILIFSFRFFQKYQIISKLNSVTFSIYWNLIKRINFKSFSSFDNLSKKWIKTKSMTISFETVIREITDRHNMISLFTIRMDVFKLCWGGLLWGCEKT